MGRQYRQILIATLVLSVFVAACTKQETPPTATTLPATTGLQTHEGKGGGFAVDLPGDWVAFTAKDRAPIAITAVGDVLEYGKGSDTLMTAEVLSSATAARQPDETWLQFYVRVLLSPRTFNWGKVTMGANAYDHLTLTQPGDGLMPHQYLMTLSPDSALVLGFNDTGETTRMVLGSVRKK